MGYKPTSEARECVEEKDIFHARVQLENKLRENLENSDGAVDGLRNYFVEHLKGFYEEHDGELYPLKDRAEWTEDYLEKNVFPDLHENFSEKRFDHALEVGKVIGKRRKSGGKRPGKPSTERKQTPASPKNNGKAGDKKKSDASPSLLGFLRKKAGKGLGKGMQRAGGPLKKPGQWLEENGKKIVEWADKD